uniref:Uncharacterized protein n=1 Tax=Romanomermis culicivorax TaxID=13658 RepID=A0A915KB47_ROMCU
MIAHVDYIVVMHFQSLSTEIYRFSDKCVNRTLIVQVTHRWDHLKCDYIFKHPAKAKKSQCFTSINPTCTAAMSDKTAAATPNKILSRNGYSCLSASSITVLCLISA